MFGPGDSARGRVRQAMAALPRIPQDDEAQTFYALALLATLPRGDASLPCGSRPARSPRRRSRETRSIPARRITSCMPTITWRWRARRYRPRAPTRRSRRRRATRSTCRRTRSCNWDSGTKPPRPMKRRGTPRLPGRSGADCRWPARFHSLAWLQYEWTQQGRFAKTKEAIAFVDEALKALRPSRPQASSPQHAAAMDTASRARSGEAATRPRCGTTAARCARATSSRASAGAR